MMGGCQGNIHAARSAGTQTLPRQSESHNDSSDSQSTTSTTTKVDHHHHHTGKEEEEQHLPPAGPLEFGKPLREAHFPGLDPAYHNLNHASFGTIPAHIQARLRHYQARHEHRPDQFIRYTYPPLLATNRAAVAALLRAPLDCTVLVPNATTAVNTVLRGLPPSFWSADGRDEILYFSTLYDACAKTVAYLGDATGGAVRGRRIPLTYPVSDAALVAQFRAAVHHARHVAGTRPRLALFDTVSSLPGVRVPFERLVAACRELGLLSLVDGAQGVGMLPLDLGALDPDFFVTNCHKWLFVPRACAVLYVPHRNHHLVRSTLPTSHSYVPDPSYTGAWGAQEEGMDASSMLPSSSSSNSDGSGSGGDDNKREDPENDDYSSSFAEMFAYVGTLDNSPYLCVQDAIEWRDKVLCGEDRIREYCFGLARHGGDRVAEILGTWIMQNEEGTLVHCSMVNVALPLVVVPPSPANKTGPSTEDGRGPGAKANETRISYKDAQRIWEWMTKVLVDEYQTFIPVYYHAGRFWARLSAQVYLDMVDFEWAGKTLKELSSRVANKEYDQVKG